MTTKTYSMPIVQRRGAHGQPLAPRRSPMMLMEEPVPGGREEPVPSPWERIVAPPVATPEVADLPVAAATTPVPQTAPAPKKEAEAPMTTKQGWPGLYPLVETAIHMLLDGKEEGDTFTSSDIVPLVQEAYELMHGREPDRHVIQVVLAGKLKILKRLGLIRLAAERKGIGGAMTWAAVKSHGGQLAAAASVAHEERAEQEPPALEEQPQPAEQQPAPEAAAAPAADEQSAPAEESRPDPAARLAELEAAHEQDQRAIAELRQRVAELEDELRLASPKGSLVEFFAQVRESRMRVVVEAG